MLCWVMAHAANGNREISSHWDPRKDLSGMQAPPKYCENRRPSGPIQMFQRRLITLRPERKYLM